MCNFVCLEESAGVNDTSGVNDRRQVHSVGSRKTALALPGERSDEGHCPGFGHSRRFSKATKTLLFGV